MQRWSCQGGHPSEQQRKEANQLPEQAHSQRKGSPSLLEVSITLNTNRCNTRCLLPSLRLIRTITAGNPKLTDWTQDQLTSIFELLLGNKAEAMTAAADVHGTVLSQESFSVQTMSMAQANDLPLLKLISKSMCDEGGQQMMAYTINQLEGKSSLLHASQHMRPVQAF